MSEPTQRQLPPIAPADVDFRVMRPADVERGLQLCRLAGWDQVQRDWERFISDEKASVSVAIHPKTHAPSSSNRDAASEIIGTVATIRYGAEFGWIGMPSYAGVLSDSQIESIVLFIKSLADNR